MSYDLFIHFGFNCCEVEASWDLFVVATNSYVDYLSVFNSTEEWPRADKVF